MRHRVKGNCRQTVTREVERYINDFEHDGWVIEYTVEAECYYTPAEGDGWNSERIPASMDVCEVTVTKVRVFNTDGDEVRNFAKSIPGLIDSGQEIELTKDEIASFEREAWEGMEEAL